MAEQVGELVEHAGAGATVEHAPEIPSLMSLVATPEEVNLASTVYGRVRAANAGASVRVLSAVEVVAFMNVLCSSFGWCIERGISPQHLRLAQANGLDVGMRLRTVLRWDGDDFVATRNLDGGAEPLAPAILSRGVKSVREACRKAGLVGSGGRFPLPLVVETDE